MKANIATIEWVRADIFGIRPIDDRYTVFGIQVLNDEKAEEMIDLARDQIPVEVSILSDGALVIQPA